MLNKEQLNEYKNHILLLHKPFKKEEHLLKKSNINEIDFLRILNNCHRPINLFINRKQFLLLFLIYQNDPYIFYNLENFDSKTLKHFASLKE